jgi:putative ABC transport system permease protein
MIMIVRERRREIGVIKAIGGSNATIASQFSVEAITLTLMGSVIGVGLSSLASGSITKILVDNSTQSNQGPVRSGVRAFAGPGGRALGGVRNGLTNIHAAVGWDILLYGLGAAILIAVIGSALASFAIAKVRPAEVMRTE